MSREYATHRVVLSSGRAVLLCEEKDAISVASEDNAHPGEVGMYVCKILCDGVLVMPNSGDDTNWLITGLKTTDSPGVVPISDAHRRHVASMIGYDMGDSNITEAVLTYAGESYSTLGRKLAEVEERFELEGKSATIQLRDEVNRRRVAFAYRQVEVRQTDAMVMQLLPRQQSKPLRTIRTGEIGVITKVPGSEALVSVGSAVIGAGGTIFFTRLGESVAGSISFDDTLRGAGLSYEYRPLADDEQLVCTPKGCELQKKGSQ